jgi:hypothetical protein
MILCACLLVPSLAFARAFTTEELAVDFLGVDVVILFFAFICVLISSVLDIRLLTLFSTINMVVSIIGILLKVIIYFGATILSAIYLLDFSALIALYATGYLVFAVIMYFVILLIRFVVRSFAHKKQALRKKPTQ